MSVVSIRVKVGSETGGSLNAYALVEGDPELGFLSVILESAGGVGDRARNPDYAQALRLILERFSTAPQALLLEDAEVDSQTTTSLARDQRHLVLRNHTYPIALDSVSDFEALRKDLTGA